MSLQGDVEMSRQVAPEVTPHAEAAVAAEAGVVAPTSGAAARPANSTAATKTR